MRNLTTGLMEERVKSQGRSESEKNWPPASYVGLAVLGSEAHGVNKQRTWGSRFGVNKGWLSPHQRKAKKRKAKEQKERREKRQEAHHRAKWKIKIKIKMKWVENRKNAQKCPKKGPEHKTRNVHKFCGFSLKIKQIIYFPLLYSRSSSLLSSLSFIHDPWPMSHCTWYLLDQCTTG